MHSKTYSEIFDKDLMREYFNNEYELADVRKRTAVFFELWMDWRQSRVKLKKNKMLPVQRMLKQLGYKEFFHFQVRSGEVRFRDTETKALALLSGLQEYER